MTTAPIHAAPRPEPPLEGWRPSRGRVGVACLIGTESAFFAGFVVAYLFYVGQSRSGPQPWQVLELPPVLVNSAALLSSSITVVLALKSLARGAMTAFHLWLLSTILLGGYFLWGTGVEWDVDLTEPGLKLLPTPKLWQRANETTRLPRNG